MESYKSLIGKKIQNRRIEKGFRSQAAFAKALGTDQPQVSRWESGANIPTGTLRDALCKSLEVSDDFFELIEVEAPPVTRESLLGSIVAALAAMDEDELSSVASLIDGLLKSKPGSS